MNVDTWCREHGITKANYYYRLRRVRKACWDSCDPAPTFVEIPLQSDVIHHEEFCDTKPAAILRNAKGLSLEIYNHTSADIVRGILEVLKYAE